MMESADEASAMAWPMVLQAVWANLQLLLSFPCTPSTYHVVFAKAFPVTVSDKSTLLSKIYGLILAREVVQACDRVPFPWHRRYGIRRIV